MMANSAAQKGKFPQGQMVSTFLKHNKKTILPVVIVFCLPVLLYLQTVGFGFTYFDDHDLILNNLAFLSDFRNVPRTFLNDASLAQNSHYYRPLQTASYMTDIFLSGGNNAWMYHLTNILLLGLTACALFLLMRKFLIPSKLALVSTLIFCAHPLFNFFVAWIPSRGDLLLALFSLLSFIFFIEHLQKKKPIFLFLHWLSFTIALFCKETALFLLFVYIIYYFAFSPEKRFDKKYLLNIALYAFSAIFWLWLRSRAIGNVSISDEMRLAPLISNLQTIPESLSSFFLPFDIALIPRFSLFKTLTGLGIMILITVVFFINKERTKKEKIFHLSWFILLMLPGMIVKEEFIDYLNHRFFLPLVGILLFILILIPKKWIEETAIKRKIVVNGVYFFIFALLSSITVVNSRSYSDPMTFWNASISQNPTNALNYNNRGYVKEIKSDFQGAINDYTNALKLNPNFEPAYYNLGNVYANKGDFAEAIKNYEKAAAINPNDANIYYNLGNTYTAKGNLERAIEEYNKAIGLNPYYAEAYNNLGLAYQALGDLESALQDYDKAIELKPGLAEAYYNRGNSYLALGNFENAIRDYQKAIELNQNYAEAYNNLGLAYQALGDLESALQDYDKAIELKPGLAEAYYNRGSYYLVKGAFDSALQDYDKAIELKPGYAEAYGNRGIAYSAKGDLTTAIKDYQKAIELNPGDADAYGNLGNAYNAKGMTNEAEQNLKMYKKLTGKKQN
jgi:tetratricopeptide (TPR) repeat protein